MGSIAGDGGDDGDGVDQSRARRARARDCRLHGEGGVLAEGLAVLGDGAHANGEGVHPERDVGVDNGRVAEVKVALRQRDALAQLQISFHTSANFTRLISRPHRQISLKFHEI